MSLAFPHNWPCDLGFSSPGSALEFSRLGARWVGPEQRPLTDEPWVTFDLQMRFIWFLDRALSNAHPSL